VTRLAVVEVRIIKRTVSALDFILYTDLFETYLPFVLVLFAETEWGQAIRRVRRLTEAPDAALAFVTSLTAVDVTCRLAETETFN